MTNRIYDAANPLPAPGTTLELSDSGNTIIDLEVKNTAGIAIQAGVAATQRILIGASGIADGQSHAIDLKGAASAVYNEGTIKSAEGTGILFSGAGTSLVTNKATITGATGIAVTSADGAAKLDLFNSGLVSATSTTITAATGMAILGGAGADRIVNIGEIKTASAILMDLGAGDDFYDGLKGTVSGGGIIKLGAGNDTAWGGTGAEIFAGGEGNDTIDGGGGNDTADYSGATEVSGKGVNVDLSRTSAQDVGGGQGIDLLIDIENVTGSAYADTLIGSTGNNSLKGGEGNDVLDGGRGVDTLDGGAGEDTVKYLGANAVIVDLLSGAGPDSDKLIDVENIESGLGADSLTGNAVANKLSSGPGSDTLNGGGGNDTIDGGTGNNTAVFSGAESDYHITTESAPGVPTKITVVDQRAGTPDGTDTLTNIRFLQFSGENNKTVALHNANPNDIVLTRATVSEGAAIGSSVGSVLGGDPDNDALTYSLADSAGGLFSLNGSSLVLANALNYEAATSHRVVVRAQDAWGGVFEKAFTISVTNNDQETAPIIRSGTDKDDFLFGELGNDVLRGLGGNDYISGNAGDDMLYGGAGKDTLIGGVGRDVFVLDAKPNAKTNIDFISGFNVADDTIHLARKAFSKIKKGGLKKDAFVIGNRVYDKEDRIIYLKKEGALFYDKDGTGSAKAVQIATIDKNLKLTHKDFFIV